MQEDQEKWITKAMNSLEGMQAAQPPADLFSSITQRLNQHEAKVIPLRRIQISIAVASLLLLLNVFALRSYSHNDQAISQQTITDLNSSSQLLSNFKIYE